MAKDASDTHTTLTGSFKDLKGGLIWPPIFYTIFIPPSGLIVLVAVVRPFIIPAVHVIVIIVCGRVVFVSASHEATV